MMPVHQKRAISKTKIDAREGFKLSNGYTNEKNLPSKIDTQKNTGKNGAWEDLKVLGEHTNEKNSSDIPNTKSENLNSKELLIIIILAFVIVPDIKHIIRNLLRPKKLSLIIVTFLGVYVVRDYIIWQDHKKPKKDYIFICIVHTIFCRFLQDQESAEETLNNSDQETDKNEIYENELKNSDSAKIDENSNPNNPASTLDDDNRPPLIMSRYDPNIDYERLMCEDIYEDLKGDPFIEEMMNGIRKNYGEL
ncbi:uncharacterized protein OCT59_002831 [Rhizophagus irregularis]|uniref:uncharacterized protein n=1 Tax=Rhizophagus irregularis TaxID=588596 RepID=UPI0019FCEAF6|nr:hypothetical protein OCT59_002831 [Rhizophagus irregularis]GBC36505.2 hypothetical protein RIR_jg28768.t1 [Rhizophagus irregularis DAOM 181602=DAOM 197198]